MATRKPASAAAINRQIDAINRKMNPVLSEEDAAFVREARARIKELDSLILQAIDARNWTTADRLDVQRGKLWKQVDKLEGRKPRSNNPARTATLVAKRSGNPGARNLAAPRKKPRENWPRFVVEEKEGVGPWMPRASFRILEDAEKLARDIHRAQPTIAVRVIDTKS